MSTIFRQVIVDESEVLATIVTVDNGDGTGTRTITQNGVDVVENLTGLPIVTGTTVYFQDQESMQDTGLVF